MLHLKTAQGERLELPAHAIIAVMRPSSGDNPSAIIFDMGMGPQIDQLGDQYGFVKKLIADSNAMVNPIEIRVVEPVPDGDGATAEGRMFFPRDRIAGRREVKDDQRGVRSTLFVNLLGKPIVINAADTLDELDGIGPEPKRPRRPSKSPTKGA
ncbi:hypothetical protein GCM10007897_15220 [Sphingobium jiangsuense]|uniref:Uncharacterized protein n=1 Tax=Sphingobium jiangsuense TaxID=870476 RepID=A0A7W6FNP7_9SPHN|nr:hypothetical protein [Sphingobium jiangsuense]MBB3925033.1 hypothetical protein [Sphingobium jiangsuense]GLT00138.1 hypothetical protein GCM10007897_15220 [Sphingobium jiangsuense]